MGIGMQQSKLLLGVHIPYGSAEFGEASPLVIQFPVLTSTTHILKLERSSSLFLYTLSGRKQFKNLGLCYPCRRPKWNSKQLALVWPNLYWENVRSESVDGQPICFSLFLSPSLSLSLPIALLHPFLSFLLLSL